MYIKKTQTNQSELMWSQTKQQRVKTYTDTVNLISCLVIIMSAPVKRWNILDVLYQRTWQMMTMYISNAARCTHKPTLFYVNLVCVQLRWSWPCLGRIVHHYTLHTSGGTTNEWVYKTCRQLLTTPWASQCEWNVCGGKNEKLPDRLKKSHG